MVGSLKVGDNVITTHILKAQDGLSGNIIKTRLLDGTYQVQTIGTATKYFDINCIVTNDGKVLLDGCYAISNFLNFYLDGNYYIGILDAYPKADDTIQANDKADRWFTVALRLNVHEEGVAT